MALFTKHLYKYKCGKSNYLGIVKIIMIGQSADKPLNNTIDIKIRKEEFDLFQVDILIITNGILEI